MSFYNKGIPNAVATTQATSGVGVAVGNTADNGSETTLSVDTLGMLNKQEQLYETGGSEKLCNDTKSTIKRYLRKVYRQVKFTSHRGKEFEKPDFVPRNVKDGNNEYCESQTVQMCNWILKQLGTL